jgi:hypothetical protein
MGNWSKNRKTKTDTKTLGRFQPSVSSIVKNSPDTRRLSPHTTTHHHHGERDGNENHEGQEGEEG